ncbi:amidase family protein [Amycolatopsis sp.]|uniref:amidase family protein n=1 Tax=Amycolatopsis sp. TaxID=37632 RepID=UPI002C59CD9D|nr:amidase family protein [Amycolatopsis sp.]HVV11229.1 amidase family protein [Amycolatopsis sp.]
MTDPAALTATAAAAAIRRKELSCRELLEAFLVRIEKSSVNAVVTVDAERARDRATELDKAAARDNWLGPLHGLPFTVKDAIATADVRTTSGAIELRDHVPVRDATAVARLWQAGGILLGKTNTPAWCGDVETFNEVFGTTRNPWAPERTSGGSSGGSAAAVATNLSAFDLATDIGGSLRIPSAFCGTFALKPTFGIVPADGYLDTADGGDYELDMNVLGPITRSAADLRLLLDVLTRTGLPEPGWTGLSGLRVAVWPSDPLAPPDPGTAAALDRVAALLAGAGARLTGAHPTLGPVHEAFLTCLRAETALSHPDGPAVDTRDWLRALRVRARQRAAWEEWFESVDLLLCPVTPVVAFPHDQRGASREREITAPDGTVRLGSSLTVWTGIASSLYLPAAAVPAGRTADGLPVAVQVIGPRLADRAVVRAAEAISLLAGSGR